MGEHQTAKLFMHGGSQAVRLPKAFRFDGGEVRIRKEGDRVILEPATKDWTKVWEALDALGGDDFPSPPAQPPLRDVSLDD